MSELTLFLYEDGSSDPLNRVNWPPERPHLQAFLMADEKIALVNTSFIIANTPPGHRVYFVLFSPWAYEHENMKDNLKSLGVLYEETIETVGEATVGLFRRRKVDIMSHHIFSSTDRRDVVKSMFDTYTSWESRGSFYFFIAREEPTGWKNILDILHADEPLPTDLVLKSHCVMRTDHDHGIVISSTEVMEEQVREIARNVAKDLSMYLSVRRFSAPNVRKDN